MIFVLRQLRGGQQNQTLVDRKIDGQVLTIGRGADRDILINDSRVAWSHAEVRIERGDRFRLVVANEAPPVLLNGAPSAGGKLKDGDVLSIGGTDITFRVFEDRIYIEVQAVRRAKDEGEKLLRAKARLSLEESGVSKRRWSWALFAVVLSLGLLLPLGVRYLPAEVSQSVPVVFTDSIWNPGPISNAHRAFAQQCDACHLQAFQMVPDAACTECHAAMPHHVADPAEMHAAGMEAGRCAGCHLEHEGPDGNILAHPAVCTDCHGQIAEALPASGQSNVTDFMAAHPQFSPTIWRVNASGVREEASTPWEPRLQEASALVFPHDLHMDPDGVDDRRGDPQVLECSSCHVYEQGEVSFAPVAFGPHCQDCHSLEFDPLAPGRELPHGSTDAVVQDLRGYYARAVLEGRTFEEMATPGGPRGRGRSTAVNRPTGSPQEVAEAVAMTFAEEAMRIRLCAKCHLVEPNPARDAGWDVTPFQQRAVWMTAARFDHSRHQATGCGSCHAAESSASADDVLMPAKASCESCHGGNTGSAERIASTCIMCHGFHEMDETPWQGYAHTLADGMKAASIATDGINKPPNAPDD